TRTATSSYSTEVRNAQRARLTSSVRRIAERTEKQRHVIVLRLVVHVERDHDFGKKRGLVAVVGADAEADAKRPALERFVEERAAAAVAIGLAVADDDPVVRFFALQRDANAG